MSNINKSKKNSGFTIIEMLVSISIIGIISGLFMVNYHDSNKRLELVGAIQGMAGDIRLAQNFTLGLKEFGEPVPEVPAGGWGVHFDKDTNAYVVFADVDGNNIYSDASEKYDKNTDLPVNVAIESISVGGVGGLTSADIVFLPPDPVTYINESSSTDAVIVLKDTNNTIKSVFVNYLGLIEVQ